MKRISFKPFYSFNFKLQFLLCFFTFQLLSYLLIGAVITVGPSGDYQKIQDAIDNSYNGDEIIVSEGTYMENINFLGRKIILRSTNPIDENVVKNTIIDGNRAGSVISFVGSETSDCILSGFTVINGFSNRGGGIDGEDTKATVKYNIITKNQAKGIGGGLSNCNGVIEDNSIIENEAYWIEGPPYHSVGSGGGLGYCDGIIRNNFISNNSVGNSGGGLYSCNGTIQNNIITDNTDSAVSWCNGIIQNNVIVNNTTGISGCDGTIQNNIIYGNIERGLSFCRGFIVNCIIWGNTQNQVYQSTVPMYSCIQGWSGGGIGNIAYDPKFVDPANSDFHLQLGSPCIDSGNKYYLIGKFVVDIDGEGRIAGSSVDMGCDEYNSNPDSDGDFLVDTQEAIISSNSNDPDTDNDGLRDGAEILRGTNPIIADLPSGISVPTQFSSIQKAIFLSFPGEKITVEQDVYKEAIHFLGKKLILQSINHYNKGVVNNTIIDGEGIHSVLFFSGQEDETSIVRGFTLQNGYGINGGGISGNGTLATIENNKIINNIAYSDGGGLNQCDGLIQNNIIYNNKASFGAGISYSDGTIQNTTIYGNVASGHGGGIAYCYGVRNCILWGNLAESDPQLYSSYPMYACCIQGWTGTGSLNINYNPQLFDPSNGNFHLKPTSPCIDAGEFISGLTKDFEGDNRPFNGYSGPEPRGDGSDFDIGADEYVPSTTNVTSWIYW